MIDQTKSSEQLSTELSFLREQNQALSVELAFHKKVFKQMHEALGTATKFKSDDAVRQLAEENEKLKSQLKFARLSDREKEILKLIANGYTSKEIAESLNISKLTVDTHRKNIQQKLNVSNMVELLRIAMHIRFN